MGNPVSLNANNLYFIVEIKKKHISGSTPVVLCKAKLYKVHLISPLHCDQHIWKQTKNDSLRREIIDIFTKQTDAICWFKQNGLYLCGKKSPYDVMIRPGWNFPITRSVGWLVCWFRAQYENRLSVFNFFADCRFECRFDVEEQAGAGRSGADTGF